MFLPHWADSLFQDYFGEKAVSAEKMKGGGSQREFYRLKGKNHVCLGVYFEDTDENVTFRDYSSELNKIGLSVPKFYALNSSQNAYLFEDLGNLDMASHLSANQNCPQSILKSYLQVLPALRNFHLKAGAALQKFNPDDMRRDYFRRDVDYFYKHFIDYFELNALLNSKFKQELENLLNDLSKIDTTGFVSRDFQSRNIMLLGDKPFIIDFQGGMMGSDLYDLASMLFSSTSFLETSGRTTLLETYYRDYYQNISYERFVSNFNRFALIRRLRSLGTYAYLGFVMRKDSFNQALAPSFQPLAELLEDDSLSDFTEIKAFALALQEQKLSRFA